MSNIISTFVERFKQIEMTEKGIDLLRQINNGKKLFEFKTVVLKKNTVTYKLENKTVHPSTVKSLMGDYLMRGSSTKTVGGYKTELLIIESHG